MKQYLSPEQTAKLIELGFERPFRNEYLHIVEEYGYAVDKYRNFSIGELIEMLMTIKGVKISFEAMYGGRLTLIVKRLVGDKWDILYGNVSKELVDLLFDLCVKLKEEGVI